MRRKIVALLLALGAVPVMGATASAQGLVRYVASYGNNANPCTRTQPCRTLQAGVNAAPAGGEVQVLDSGEYTPQNTPAAGAVAIHKSITISSIGARASLTSRQQFDGGIFIGNEGINVVLRGLHLNGAGVGDYGIAIGSDASVHIEHCTIERFTQHGISGSIGAELFISNTVLRENGLNGIDWGNTPLMIDRSRFERNGASGLSVAYSFRSTVTRSTFAGNGYHGIAVGGGRMSVEEVTATYNGTAIDDGAGIRNYGAPLTLEHFIARGNDIGLSVGEASSGTRVVLSNSVITNNGIGIHNEGFIRTRGNNLIRGNNTNLQGNPLVPVQGQ
jgi:hypothetical protein